MKSRRKGRGEKRVRRGGREKGGNDEGMLVGTKRMEGE